MNKKILFLILSVTILSLPIISSAADGAFCEMVSNVEWVTWWVGGSIIVIGWVIAGILYLTAGGGSRMEIAKKALIAAVIGTILIALSSTAATIVIDALGQKGEVESCSD